MEPTAGAVAPIAGRERTIRVWIAINAAILALWLLVPLAIGIFEDDRDASESENRSLAQWPSLPVALAEAPNWLTPFADYLRDQIGLREAFTNAHAWALYSIGVSANPDVVIGSDGFLFQRTLSKPGDYLEESFGRLRLAQDEVNAVVGRIAKNADRAALIGVPYLVAIVPNKSIVYKKYLPQRYRERISDDRMLGQVAKEAEHRNIPFLDLSQAILRVSKNQLSWLRHDTHWNSVGAWAAYQAIADKIEARYGHSVIPLDSEDVKFQGRATIDGDLAKLLGLRGLSEMTFDAAFAREVEVQSEEFLKDGNRTIGSLIRTTYVDGPRIMILADSFFWRLRPLLIASSSEILWLRQLDFTVPWDKVEEFRPSAIISLYIESNFILKRWMDD